MADSKQAPFSNGINNHRSKAVTVLVTGFGPFQEKYPVNPSYEIARSLPHSLPKTTGDNHDIKVIAYGLPIRVCYAEARELIPTLLESFDETIDLVLHIGMASGRRYYTAERLAHRGDYVKNKDLDGKIPQQDEEKELFSDCPANIETSLDYQDVLRRWRFSIMRSTADSPAHDADCRPSDDAGHYLCDYTYFNSLAWYARRHKKYEGGSSSDRPVMFLHVPAESDVQTLQKGQAVAMALIQAMVESYAASNSA